MNGFGSNGRNGSNGSFDAINKKSVMEDFDFEKNLALFDKTAFYEEMMNETQPSQSRLQPSSGLAGSRSATNSSHNLSRSGENVNHASNISANSGRNYRYDEMILDTGDPINFQQIQVTV